MTDEERDQYRHYLAAFAKTRSGGVVDMNPSVARPELLVAAALGAADGQDDSNHPCTFAEVSAQVRDMLDAPAQTSDAPGGTES